MSAASRVSEQESRRQAGQHAGQHAEQRGQQQGEQDVAQVERQHFYGIGQNGFLLRGEARLFG